MTDVDPARQALARSWGAAWVEPGEALLADVDVVVPAAVGGLLTADVVAALRCRAVVGPANNQLDDDATAAVLHDRGICWAPDTVVSAGGIVSAVARELQSDTPEAADRQVREIGRRLSEILTEAAVRGTSPLTQARRQTEALLR